MKELTKIESRFVELTNAETFKKECSFALQHIAKKKQLEKATTESKLQAVLNIAQTGLSLNPVLKLAYMVPRWNALKKQVEAHLEPSYQGLCKLITDTGAVTSMECHLVHKNDDYKIAIHTPEKINHSYGFGDRGDIVGAYSIATLANGERHLETMSIKEVHAIRETSESWKAHKAGKIKTCIWSEHEGEMIRKTVIRRHVKYLPKTDERLGRAIELDEQDYSASDDQVLFIEDLLTRANLSMREKESLEMELSTMGAQRASEVIGYLKENQVNPVTHGGNPSATEINQHIKEITE